jgi:hypothetical protein
MFHFPLEIPERLRPPFRSSQTRKRRVIGSDSVDPETSETGKIKGRPMMAQIRNIQSKFP